jgi:hypothetical protein
MYICIGMNVRWRSEVMRMIKYEEQLVSYATGRLVHQSTRAHPDTQAENKFC